MLEAVLSGIPLGIFLSFLIGPVFFVLLETSAVKGFRAAFVLDLGVVSADIIFIFIAYFSSYRLIKPKLNYLKTLQEALCLLFFFSFSSNFIT